MEYSIPEEIKETNSYYSIKKKAKRHILSQ